MRYDLSKIMGRAWELKKQHDFMAKRFVEEKASFGECLKQAWREAKESQMVRGWVIPAWLMQEKEIWGINGFNGFCTDSMVEKESKKAFKIYGAWIPKSQCTRESRIA